MISLGRREALLKLFIETAANTSQVIQLVGRLQDDGVETQVKRRTSVVAKQRRICRKVFEDRCIYQDILNETIVYSKDATPDAMNTHILPMIKKPHST